METLPTTIEECHQVIRLLLSKLDDISKRLDVLEIENKQLRLENTQLKERLNNNSSNSSLPPSKSFKKKKNNRQSSGKTSGGQRGHKGHYREMLPSNQVDSIKDCELAKNCLCGGKIKLTCYKIRTVP
jgi:transposase